MMKKYRFAVMLLLIVLATVVPSAAKAPAE